VRSFTPLWHTPLWHTPLWHTPLWLVVSALLAGPAVRAAPPPGLAYQLTHAVTADPSPAPDGRRMVYLSVVAGREQLFVANLDGSQPVQLTRDDFDHEDPAWSPDGSKIAFVSMQGGHERIAIMDPDGSHVELLTPAASRTIHPHWSADSQRIAYCTDDDLKPPRKNDSDIQVLDRKTRRITTLVTGGTNTYPAWSPDGKQLAFRRMLGALDSEVFLANGDGTGPRNLTNHPAFDGWPAWSPDGTRIAFASNRRSSYQIFVMKSDGSDVTLVANTEGRATAPVWSRDGASIYFSNCRNIDLGHDCQILVAPAPAAKPQRRTRRAPHACYRAAS
jgi:TolB protein